LIESEMVEQELMISFANFNACGIISRPSYLFHLSISARIWL